MVDDGDAKSMLQDCATDSVHFYDATSVDQLTKSFQQIVLTFSKPRLVK